MKLSGDNTKSTGRPDIHAKGKSTAAASTGKSTGTEKNVPQAQTAAALRATLNTANPVAKRPLRTWVIKHMPAFIQRREAKKLAPKATEFQVSKMLQALNDGDTNDATTAALKLKAAVAPLVSKKPGAQTRDELLATYMGKQLPLALEDLDELRHTLKPLEGDSVLGLLSFVVKAHILNAKTALLQDGLFNEVDPLFFERSSKTEVHQLKVPQLIAVAGMGELAGSIAQLAQVLSRGDEIPGTELTVSAANRIVARADAAKQLLETRKGFISDDLGTLTLSQLRTLRDKTRTWLMETKTPPSAPVYQEIKGREENTLKAIRALENAEQRAADLAKSLAEDVKALDVKALEKLLDRLSILSKLVPMDTAQHMKLGEQQSNAIHRITELQEKILQKKGTR